MTRTRTKIGLAALLTILAAAPAFAVPPPSGGGCRVIRGATTTDPADDVSVCRQDVYFHKGSKPVGNLAAGGDATILPSWNTTRPTGELQDAGVFASSGEVDIFAAEGSPVGRAQFVGTFTGTLDTLGFRYYLRSPFDEANGSKLGAELRLEVDGEVIFDNYTATASIPLPMVAEGDLYRIDGAFTNLYDYMNDNGLDMSSTKEHTVKVGIVGWHFPGSESVFLFDADDAAAGLFFNLENNKMAGFAKVDVNATA